MKKILKKYRFFPKKKNKIFKNISWRTFNIHNLISIHAFALFSYFYMYFVFSQG